MRQSVDIAIPYKEEFVAIYSPKHKYRACLPGGKSNDGEDLLTAVVRECFEETGLVLINPIPFYSSYVRYGFSCVSFVSQAIGTVKSSKEGEAKLADRKALYAGPFSDFYKDMFKYYDKLDIAHIIEYNNSYVKF